MRNQKFNAMKGRKKNERKEGKNNFQCDLKREEESERP